MKVDKIYQNYNNGGHYERSKRGYSNISFSKKAPTSLNDKIMTNLPNKKSIKFMKSLEWLKGEVGGILITAIGTGLVAPFPIAYNPFVKAPKGATEEEIEDVKNTKKYSAMRQPISAVLAILFQVSALKPIDKFLDVIFNDPRFAKHVGICNDQSAINSKSRIENLAKKKIKEEQPSLKGKEYKELLESTKKQIENTQVCAVADKLRESGKLMVGERALDNKHLAEIINLQIDDYIKDAYALKINNDKMAYYSKKAKILVENEDYLKEIFKNAPNDSTKITEYVKNLLSKESNPDVKILLEEILEKPSEIQYNRIKRSLERIETIKSMCNGKYSFDKYLDAMSTRNARLNTIITKLKLNKIEKTDKATKESVEKAINSVIENCRFDESNSLLKTILHDTDTFNFDKEKLTGKVYKDVAKQYKEFVRNHYKGTNQIIKIAVGVGITLPITCNVLNWVYPRIMDKWFPELAGSKKAQKAREVK